jgi:hypothetical protein
MRLTQEGRGAELHLQFSGLFMEILFLLALCLVWLISGASEFSGTVKRHNPRRKQHAESGHDRAARRERALYPEFWIR